MPIHLYYMLLSPPCRSVMMTAKLLGINYIPKLINLDTQDHLKPEFLKINPQHNIPTIDDDGYFLNESRAICGYLVHKYGQNDRLYPKEPQQRGIVDQRLYFDACVFYQTLSDYYYPVIFGEAVKFDVEAGKRFESAREFLDMFLSKDPFAAGDHITIADLALIASASSAEAMEPTVFDKYPNIKKWMARCKEEIADYQEINQAGADLLGEEAQAAYAKLK